MKRKTIHLEERIWTRLEKIASDGGLRVADLVRRAVAEFLKREEKKEENNG